MADRELEVVISKQSDGLWRAEVPALQGCFVDSDTLEDALSDIQEAIRLWFSSTRKLGWPLPEGIEDSADLQIVVKLRVTVP